MNWNVIWTMFWKLLPQLAAAEAVLQAKGGHGTFVLDLNVLDKATGLDVIPAVEVAEITL